MQDPTRRHLLALAGVSVAGGLAGCAGLLDSTTTDDDDGKTDDWQYDPGKSGGTSSGQPTAAMQAARGAGGTSGNAESVGLAAGGQKRIATFRRNVSEGYLPQPQSLTYAGLFYNYYFETGGSGGCSSRFCPSYSPAVTADPLSGETERYLTVGLHSNIAKSEFDRKRLNFVVVMDVSGSMDASFSQYYYDKYGNRKTPAGETERPKIEVAKEALAAMTEQLRPDDRLGIVLYNDEASVAKPLRKVSETDMDAIRSHIKEDIQAGGGTRLSAGIDAATSMLGEYDGADPTAVENRMLVLTDAMPNLGETDSGGLRGTLADSAERGLYSTFVGVGLDFNAKLVEAITSIEGANYFAVHSAEQFERRLTDEFEYVVTPLVFDLELALDAEGYDIEQVYGSTAAEEATGRLMKVNTLFASPTEGGKTRGGVVLVQVSKEASEATMELTATWENRDGSTGETTTTIEFLTKEPEHFANSGVRKAVLLSRYADLLRNWMLAARDAEKAPEQEGISVPPQELGKWEQQSVPLTVSDRYESRIAEFESHFESEMQAIGDDSLKQEIETLNTILEQDGS